MAKRYKVVLVLYFLGLTYLYPDVLEVVNYMWKVQSGFSLNRMIFSIVQIVICCLILPARGFGASLLLALMVFLHIPMLSVYTLSNEGDLAFLSSVSIIITSIVLNLTDRGVKIKRIKTSKLFLRIAFLVVTLFIGLILFRSAGSFNVLQILANVYELRAENDFSGLIAYVFFWISSVFVFWMLYEAIMTKERINFLLLALAFSLGILVFLVTGLKTRLFSPIFILVLFVFLRYFKSGEQAFLMVATFPVLLIGIILKSNPIVLAVIDRIYYLPGLLQMRYFDYFLHNPLYLFQTNSFGRFIDSYDYDEPVGYVIDSAYGGGGMNANTGAFGSIFGDAGLVGVLIIFPVMIVVLNLIFNSLTKNTVFLNALGIYYGFILVNSPPVDIILTHGVILHIVFLYLYKQNTSISDHGENQK